MACRYKYCFVPCCKSTTVTAPKKLFISVPVKEPVRTQWMEIIRKDLEQNPLSPKSKFHVCEDHFDIENDVENLMWARLFTGLGKNVSIRLKPGVVPSKFDCQTSGWSDAPHDSSKICEKLLEGYPVIREGPSVSEESEMERERNLKQLTDDDRYEDLGSSISSALENVESPQTLDDLKTSQPLSVTKRRCCNSFEDTLTFCLTRDIGIQATPIYRDVGMQSRVHYRSEGIQTSTSHPRRHPPSINCRKKRRKRRTQK